MSFIWVIQGDAWDSSVAAILNCMRPKLPDCGGIETNTCTVDTVERKFAATALKETVFRWW